MKIRAIRLKEVGPFLEPVALEGFSGGLDVLMGPNESGKSTFFRALQMVLSLKHSTKSQEIDVLQPYRGGAPLIEVELEIDAAVWCLRKQFGRSRRAELSGGPKDELWRGRDAEDKLSDLIGLKDGQTGPYGLVWVAQKRGLLPPDPDPDINLQTGKGKDQGERSALMRALESEIREVSDGGIARSVLKRVRASRDKLVVKSGAKKGGELYVAEQILAATERDLEEAREVAQQTAEDIKSLSAVRERFVALSDSEHVVRLKKTYDAAQLKLQEAEKSKQNLVTAVAKRDLALQNLGAAEKQVSLFEKNVAELKQLEKVGQADDQRVRELEVKIDQSKEALDASEQDGKTASEEVEHFTKQQTLFARAAQRRVAKKQLEARSQTLQAAVQVSKNVASASKDLQSNPMTSEKLAQLDDLHRQIVLLEDRVKGAAPQVEIGYEKKPLRRIKVDGKVLKDDHSQVVREPMTLKIEDVGQIKVIPGVLSDQATQEETIKRLRSELEKALSALKVPSIEAARQKFEERQKKSSELNESNAKLGVLAPVGVDALRAEVAQLETVLSDPIEGPELESAENIDAKLSKAKAKLEQVRGRYAELNKQILEGTGELEQVRGRAAEREKRINDLLKELGETSERSKRKKEINGQVASARDEANASERLVAALKDAVPDDVALSRLKEALTKARTAKEDNEQNVQVQEVRLAELSAKIAAADRDGVGTKIAALEAQLERAHEDVTRHNRTVEALQLLERLMAKAGERSRDRVTGPVMARVGPYLEHVFPGAVVNFGDGFRVAELNRDGVGEEPHRLSEGTQEQLALLVRLAFARVFAESGRPIPVILDDPLAYSDDERIAGVFDALRSASQLHQVVVLTCRGEAFAGLEGQRLKIVPWNEAQ